MTDYDEKVLAKSSWITRELLEPVVERIVGTNVTIQHVDISAAVGAGDNYVSILYRTKVTYLKNDGQDGGVCHLIVKGPPGNDFMAGVFQDMGLIAKEIAVYNKCLPYMNRLQDRFFEKDRVSFSPESYPCDVKDTIIMEDLKMAGYRLAKRQDQLEYDHALVALKSVARFHALSVKIIEEQPEWFEDVSKEMYTVDRPDFGHMYTMCMPMFADYVEKWGAKKRIVDMCKKLADNCYHKLCEVIQPNVYKFNVINHGDLWLNNMMFKYNQFGKVTAAKLLDYQVVRYSSPALDLLYFLFSSVNPYVLSNRLFDLIAQYHKYLMKDLKQLNLATQHGVTLDQLQHDIRDHAYFGVIVIGTLLPIIVSEPTDAMDMDAFTAEDAQAFVKEMEQNNVPQDAIEQFKPYYESRNIKDIALKVLGIFDDVGYLESAYEMTKNVKSPKKL